MPEDDPGIEGWAILELMGHRRLGGYISEATAAGALMVRIDVPHPQKLGESAATQFYNPTAIYAITPTTEETARAIARGAPEPISRWDLRAQEASTGRPKGAGEIEDEEDEFSDVMDDCSSP